MTVVSAPIAVGPNQPAHFYRGGAGIARFRGAPQPSEFSPEDWIGSATSIFSRPGVGLTRLPDGSALQAAIAGAPDAYLGPDHVARYGADPALLVKMLDTGQRLVVHFHPDRDFASRHLGSRYGKTEAWIILATRPSGDDSACVYLGFKQDADPAVIKRWVADQDTSAILGSLNQLPVSPGDTWLVPAGVPHAIGAGVTLVELQEPTDFSIMLEWKGFQVDGAREGHLGLGFDLALGALDVSGWNSRRLDALHAPRADTGAAERPGVTRLLPAQADPFFAAERVDVSSAGVAFEPGYAILVVVSGSGQIEYPTGSLPVRRGSTILVPYGAGPVNFDGEFQALRCRPPDACCCYPLSRTMACFLRRLPLPSSAPPGDYWRSEQGRSEGGTPMTDAQTWSSDLNLSDNAFWAQSPERRHAGYKTLRALESPPFFDAGESPFGTVERGYYALLRHADVAEASKNPQLFSSAAGATSVYDLPTEFNEYFGSMISMDDPRHTRLRRIVSRAFTPKMIKKFEEDVQRTAGVIVDDLLATGPCDFVQQVSARLPLKIICQMMGIGEEHYDMVLRDTNIILSGADPEFVSENIQEAQTQILTAGIELGGLVSGLAEQRQASPADDLVSALATANVDGEQLTPAELASFFILLVVAGNETTRNAISHSLALLTKHPDQREVLLADFEGRIGPAVEEIVRYVSPVIWMRRTLTQDAVVNGHAYQANDKVLLMYQAANRDESVFDDPDRFDITRSPNPHVGFGSPGPHFCLGAHLARREISVILRELLTRAPGIRSVGEPDYLLSSFINGIKHLPCEFG